VAKGDRIFSAKRKGIKQEKLLFPLLDKLFAKSESTLQHVKKIFIVRGPGRFTGIRISLTFASMMQYLNHCEVRGATLFEVLRFQAENSNAFKRWKAKCPDGVIAVVLHAFREEYFLQVFSSDNPAPLWLSREELLTRLHDAPHPLYLTGTDKNGAALAGLVGDGFTVAAHKDCVVRPSSLVEMSADDEWLTHALEPLYLKPARFELVTPK
jgi:tRNA threonylcarbamoyl adenosine modification protein YeaZ